MLKINKSNGKKKNFQLRMQWPNSDKFVEKIRFANQMGNFSSRTKTSPETTIVFFPNLNMDLKIINLVLVSF